MDDQTWQRVLDALVEREYARRIAAGTPDKGRLRALIRGDYQAMADDPAHGEAWKRQQADRELGEVKRPGTAQICPACGVSFNPDDRAQPPATPSPPLHDRWTNGAYIVAVPPDHEGAYERLGYRRLPPDVDATLDGTPPTSSDEPTRGADGLLYCRQSCADWSPDVTLDEWLVANPDRADPRRYLARVADLRRIRDPAERARAALAAFPHATDTGLAPIDADQTRL